jgi:hypothetical protein
LFIFTAVALVVFASGNIPMATSHEQHLQQPHRQPHYIVTSAFIKSKRAHLNNHHPIIITASVANARSSRSRDLPQPQGELVCTEESFEPPGLLATISTVLKIRAGSSSSSSSFGDNDDDGYYSRNNDDGYGDRREEEQYYSSPSSYDSLSGSGRREQYYYEDDDDYRRDTRNGAGRRRDENGYYDDEGRYQSGGYYDNDDDDGRGSTSVSNRL